jgi:dTDP-glucose 4,6-dehydratase
MLDRAAFVLLGFDDGLAATVDWYLENETWWRDIRATRYAGERLGVGR